MNATIRLKDTRCMTAIPPDGGHPAFGMVIVDDGRGDLSIIVHPGKGATKARELAAALDAMAVAVEAEQERQERERWRPMEAAPRDGSEILVRRKHDGEEFSVAWATNYSIHGLGGHWSGHGQYGDLHLDGWKPDPVAESLDREQVEVGR